MRCHRCGGINMQEPEPCYRCGEPAVDTDGDGPVCQECIEADCDADFKRRLQHEEDERQ